MRRICSELEGPVNEGELLRMVGKHDRDGIPEREEGEVKLYRGMTLGGRREDLTPGWTRIAKRATISFLGEPYPGSRP